MSKDAGPLGNDAGHIESPIRSLPVPPLHQTLERYRAAVAPLLSADERAVTAAAIDAYAAGEGQADQRVLEAFAAAENGAGRSWLSEAWLDGYLTTRGPITLVSNVGLQLNWPDGPTGLARAADLVHRMAVVHLAWLRGELPPEHTARGDRLDSQQRRFLAGGLRHPRPGADEFIEGPGTAANREIVAFWHGAPFVLRISDEAGRPLGTAALAAAFTELASRPAGGDQAFTHLSYAGSEEAAALLERLLADDANAATYRRLADTLFAVNLVEHDGAPDEYLQHVSFGLGRTWAYKPATYDVDLSGDLAAVHLEHTVVDGATLKGAVALAQQVVPAEGTGSAPAWEPLGWRLDDVLAADIAAAARRYSELARPYRVKTVLVELGASERLPFRLSNDGAQQWVMLYAQLARYGRLRSTYEAVDMREYRAGRTECLRPNTAAAVALAQALLDDAATPDHLFAALDGHKDWVKACKSGNAIDRHLFGLRMMAARENRTPALFTDPAYPRLTTDFLSTTSLGDPYQLLRFAFAPTSTGGIGISYSTVGGLFEFCLSYRADEHDDIEEFVAALTAGTTALGALITRTATAAG